MYIIWRVSGIKANEQREERRTGKQPKSNLKIKHSSHTIAVTLY